MAKLMAPSIRIDWYPEGHFADVQNPTVAELNSGYNLSCAIVTGYTLDFTNSNTEDTTTIFDSFVVEDFLTHSYEANIQYFLSTRGSDSPNEQSFRDAESLFYVEDSPVGYLSKRFGYLGTESYSISQRVDIFKVQASPPKIITDDSGPILLEVPYIPKGLAVQGVRVS